VQTHVNGARAEVVHRIPFKPLSSGRLALPTLQVQYFDPDTGRLARIIHTPPRLLVLSLAWRIGIGVSLTLLALWLCLWLYRFSRRALQHRRQRNAALAAIRQAADARQLRCALEAVAHAEGFPANLSLREWAEHWRAHHHTNPTFDDLMARLARARYGKPAEKDESAEIQKLFYVLYRR
jgi:hypothetical protein